MDNVCRLSVEASLRQRFQRRLIEMFAVSQGPGAGQDRPCRPWLSRPAQTTSFARASLPSAPAWPGHELPERRREAPGSTAPESQPPRNHVSLASDLGRAQYGSGEKRIKVIHPTPSGIFEEYQYNSRYG